MLLTPTNERPLADSVEPLLSDFPSGWRCLEPEHVTAVLQAALGRGAGEGRDEVEGEIAGAWDQDPMDAR